MGGCRCSYKNCTNTTKSSDSIHFFHFPVKHRERCILWIENASKPNFYDLEEEQLKNKVICETHFDSKWFPNAQKKRLLQGAVPTLDGDCNNHNPPTVAMENDTPVYLPSNQYNDVKVVPANDDGTVFVLDTENMFTISPKIESYIIKNGVLVPTNSNTAPRATQGKFMKQSTSNRFTKPSTSTGYLMGAETEIANINTPPGPGPSKPIIKEETFFHPSFLKKEDHSLNNTPQNKPKDNGQFQRYDNAEPPQEMPEIEDRKPNPVAVMRQAANHQNNNHGSTKSGVSKNYLRQIKQHSREIATIKRMLKQKRMNESSKPDMKTILNVLQKQLPASLFTIISLLLGEKNELNDDDIDFFTTLHRGSPEIYQMLSEKYRWNLPSVDVVDNSPE